MAVPGVRSVALATDLPLTSYDIRAFTLEGTATPEGPQATTSLTWVHGPYFETLGMTIRRGRFFAAGEYEQERNVVIINEKLAALAWPGQDPVGKRLKWGLAASRAPWLTVIGVVGNAADGPIGVEPRIHAYEPFRQLPDFFLDGAPNQFGRDVKAAVLADGEPRALAAAVRHEISRLDPELAIESLQTMDDQVTDVVAPQRFSALLAGAFAAIALLLASVGLYGLLAFTITQRRREIAVRMALGAERQTVIRMVIAQGARLVAIGLLAGLIASFAMTRVVASVLYRTDAYDLVTFATVPAVLAVAAFIACALPAWRAARVEPMMALREDY
jgi:putative ABC transport system permease protein